MQAQLYTLKSGSQIDNYQIHRVLGVGGFGITYQAHDLSLDCAVAIKEYFPHGLAVREADGLQVGAKSQKDKHVYEYGLQRFMDEARILARFKNNNIVRVNRFMEKNGTAYIVMDYEEGVPLSRYLMRCKKLTEVEIKNVFRPILQGLKLIHNQDYLHRDIKPPNIYLRKKGAPVLLDFGAARQALSAHGRTVTNMGTHGYAPIEQFTTQERQGPWSDIYGVGATIYHCITGSSPMTALDRISALQGGRRDPMMPAQAVGKNKYDAELLECVDWMLSVRTEDRPQAVDQVITAFTMSSNDNNTILKETDVDWDSELIAQAERHLANYIGPLAMTLVRQCMTKATSVDELYQLLAQYIDMPTSRDKFMQSVSMGRSVSSKMERPMTDRNRIPRTISSRKTMTVMRLNNDFRQKLEQQLARHIGPLAKLLVEQAIARGADLDEIIEILCNELPSETERSEFRRIMAI
jgi:serine/threonine protein kinase